MSTPGPYGPYARAPADDPPRVLTLSHSQVSAMWEIVKAHALRVETARQRILTVPVTPVYDVLPGGTHAVPIPVWESINAVHRAHRAVWAAQQHLQYAEAQLLSQMLFHYCPARRRCPPSPSVLH